MSLELSHWSRADVEHVLIESGQFTSDASVDDVIHAFNKSQLDRIDGLIEEILLDLFFSLEYGNE